MASKNLTFDPDAGVPYAANLTIYGGTDFSASYTVKDTSNAAYDFSTANAVGIATTTPVQNAVIILILLIVLIVVRESLVP